MSTVSVIIPTKNRLKLLLVTLENILNQTLKPTEIIVVDDNSTDGTAEYIKQHYSQNIIVTNCKGTGPGAARNTGLLIATGKYIQFFDSDDLMTRNKLEAQVAILERNNIGMVYSPYLIAYENTLGKWEQRDVIMQYNPLPNNLVFTEWILRGWCAITQSCLFDSQLIKQVGMWRTDLMTHEDYEYLYRISRYVKYPAHTNACAVIYRQHGQQITDNQTSSIARTYDKIKVLEIMNNSRTKNEFSYLTNIIFDARIFETVKYLKQNNQDINLFSKNFSNTNLLKSIIHRSFNKINRIITKSDWQIMHGIAPSKELFNNYLNLL